jgi:hypothetical protein
LFAHLFSFGVHTVRMQQMKLMNCADQRTVVCGFSEMSYRSGFNASNAVQRRYQLRKSFEKT